MAKRLRNVALLGGAALLASKMLGRKKDETPRMESKEDQERDRREAALAGPLRALAATPTVEPKSEPKKAAPARRAPAEAPGISMEEGRSAIGLPREARGRTADEGITASGLPREARGVRVEEGATASGLPREARGVTRGDIPGSQVFAQINADRSARQRRAAEEERFMSGGMKKGGMVKSSASKRADGIATKGKTRGRMI
jgi:hypothetical protein